MNNGSKILVVDDDNSILEFLRSVLEIEGFSVSTATNGMDALEKIRRENFKAVILDIVLPDINGMSLFFKIQKIKPRLAGKVIFITGTGMGEGNTERLPGLGAGFFPKPIEIENLMQSLIFVLSEKTTRPRN
jgi:two-component system response regulator MprA